MSDLYEALASLFDSLNALSFRLARNDNRGNWIARINFRVGSIQENVGSVANPEEAAMRLHRYAGWASTIDPRDGRRLDNLLTDIEEFLTGL